LTEHILINLASIVVLGIAAQWLAWRLRIPSILLLLTFGIVAGPVTGFLHPEELFGDLLLPIVSLSVAVILYEGGLSLKLRELRGVGRVFILLISVGAIVTWLFSTVAAHLLLGFDWPLSALLGSILVVTGPTVIGPLLRHLRLSGQAGTILKWEGIVIDPLGATLSVLVFAAVRADAVNAASAQVVGDLLRTVLIGGGLGAAGAVVLILPLARYWVPDTLQNALSLTAVVGIFALARCLQDGAGLLAVTVMGIALANQKWVVIKHVIEFKENLAVLLVSGLFIVLAAHLKAEELRGLDFRYGLFLAVLVFLARPASVLLATLRSKLTWRERLFLCWMAPRGIVAASVSAVFALKMAAINVPQAHRLVPVTFFVIVGTVALYGLTAPPLARRLGLAYHNPQGILFVGAHPLACALAKALQSEGCRVLMVDSNWTALSAARLAGLPTYYGSVLADEALHDIDFSELGRLVAVTSNHEVNSLACLRFIEVFGRREVYQLPFETDTLARREVVSRDLRGRLLFGPGMTYSELIARVGERPVVKVTQLTKEFDYEAFRTVHGESVVPVLAIKPDSEILLFTVDNAVTRQPGQVVLSVAGGGRTVACGGGQPPVPTESTGG
jgi:NhaP-type Na+/H+ or K+/H+ antiporter